MLILEAKRATPESNVTALIDALGGSDKANKCEELELSTQKVIETTESLVRLTGLKEPDLSGCDGLVSLPDSVSQLVALKELNLQHFSNLAGTIEPRPDVTIYGKPEPN